MTIHVEPRMKDVDVGIFTHVGVTTGDDGPWQLVRIVGKKKVAFDVATEKDTFFEAKQAIGRNPGKLPIIDMPLSFNPSIEAGPSWKHGTMCKFFESCLSLVRD